jgi:hypothetical protein
MVDERLGRRAGGVELGSLSERVFDVLSRYTVFPWPVMMAQAKRMQLDPAALTPSDLERLLPRLVEGVERFTSPEKAEAVRLELEALVRDGG